MIDLSFVFHHGFLTASLVAGLFVFDQLLFAHRFRRRSHRFLQRSGFRHSARALKVAQERFGRADG